MAINRTRIRRTTLLTAALVLLPLGMIVLVLCLDSFAAWLQFRSAAAEQVSTPQLEGMCSAFTGVQCWGMSWKPQEPPSEPSPKRRPLNVAAVFAVLLGSLAAGGLGALVVWAFCEFDLLDGRE
jgi:hypothetical protein